MQLHWGTLILAPLILIYNTEINMMKLMKTLYMQDLNSSPVTSFIFYKSFLLCMFKYRCLENQTVLKASSIFID